MSDTTTTAPSAGRTSPNAAYAARAQRFASRKRVDQLATGLALLAMAFGLFWLYHRLPIERKAEA